jgi:hypothetical protein
LLKNFTLNLVVFIPSRYLVILCFIWVILLLYSCKKTDENVTGGANIVLVNGAYALGAIELSSSGSIITASSIDFGSVSGVVDNPYIDINAGLRNFSIRNSSAVLSNANYNIGIGQHYSLLVYDTIHANGSVSTLLMKDDLAVPDSGTAGIRFLHLSRDAGPIDIYFVSPVDTLIRPEDVYLGDISAADGSPAAFNSLDSGQYEVRVNVADTTIQLANTSIRFDHLKKYSIFIAGGRSDGSLRIYSYRHY